jgi:HK97 family phage major capsid protein
MDERKRALLEKRQVAWKAMTDIMERAAAENRDMLQDEIETYDRHEADIVAADAELDRYKRHIERGQEEREADRLQRLGLIKPQESRGGGEDEAALIEFRKFIRGVPFEQRALQADSDTEGGFLLAPQQVVAGLLKAVDNAVFMRGLATMHQLTTAESLGVPTLSTDMGDADWTAEITQSTVDEALRLGRRELKPQYLTKETKLSRPLVRRTAGRAEDLVIDRLGYLFGVTQEKAFMTGNGVGRPLGIFTASDDGIPTSRDVSTDMATTDVTADGFLEVKHTLKAAYWSRARWVMHRDVLKRARKLKNGDGSYLWSPGGGLGNGLTDGIPNTLCDHPYEISEYAPNTFTTGQYVAVLGDFSYYWIVESLGFELQVLAELYARTNQLGYIGRVEVDGMPVLAEAFVRAKLG